MKFLLAASVALTFAQEPQAPGIPILVWIILGIILLAIVLGLILGSRTTEREEDSTMRSSTITDGPVAIPQTGAVVEEAPFTTVSDAGARVYQTPLETPGVESSESVVNAHDLTRIEGIGPGMQQVLNGAGIYTYDQLARSTPDDLREMIRRSGLRAENPERWPEQARLAVQGKWDELEAIQKGG